jgi:hypothetical protein
MTAPNPLTATTYFRFNGKTTPLILTVCLRHRRSALPDHLVIVGGE